MNEQFKKRLMSFAWRLGNVLAIAGLNFVVENVADLGVPIFMVGIIGLATAELTKYLNTAR